MSIFRFAAGSVSRLVGDAGGRGFHRCDRESLGSNPGTSSSFVFEFVFEILFLIDPGLLGVVFQKVGENFLCSGSHHCR